MNTTSNSSEPPAVTTARETLAAYDALCAAGGWAGLTDIERSIWAGRLATSLRLALLVLGQRP